MLLEYFSITLDDKGHLETLPIILKGYIPNMDKLPGFLLRLGIEVFFIITIILRIIIIQKKKKKKKKKFK